MKRGSRLLDRSGVSRSYSNRRVGVSASNGNPGFWEGVSGDAGSDAPHSGPSQDRKGGVCDKMAFRPKIFLRNRPSDCIHRDETSLSIDKMDADSNPSTAPNGATNAVATPTSDSTDKKNNGNRGRGGFNKRGGRGGGRGNNRGNDKPQKRKHSGFGSSKYVPASLLVPQRSMPTLTRAQGRRTRQARADPEQP